jgi:thiol-disulfide isomerase/thioredoxin
MSTLEITSQNFESTVDGNDIVVLDAWASWCGPCKAETPALVKVENSVAASGVDFVGIDEGDDPASARTFLRSVGSDYPNLIDADGRLLARLTMLPPALPSSLVLDRKGRIAARVVGPTTAAEVTEILRQVLAGP